MSRRGGKTSNMSYPKRRKYNEDYIKYGFVSIHKSDREHPLCVICHEVLSNDAMRPSRLQRHLSSKHRAVQNETVDYFIEKSEVLNQVMLKANGHSQADINVIKASYELALIIAKAKERHDIGDLVKECMLKASQLLLGSENTQKLSQIQLSEETVNRRINNMAEDIKNHIMESVKQSQYFALQLDESTDVAECAQLITFVRYIYDNNVREEMLFTKELGKTTRTVDVVSLLSDFFGNNELLWEKLIGVCTNANSSLLGSGSDLAKLIREKNPALAVIHCITHRQALAHKTLPSEMNESLSLFIKIVNYIKKSTSNTWLFKAFCEDLPSEHKTLLFNTEAHWLSRGNLLARLLELREEVISFLNQENELELHTNFSKPEVQIYLAYLCDFLDSLNHLNLKLQTVDSDIICHRDAVMVYMEKLQLWNRKIMSKPCNYSCFPRLHTKLEQETNLKNMFKDSDIIANISHHLQKLSKEFKSCLSNSNDDQVYRLAIDPFHVEIDALPENLQEQALEMKHNSAAKYEFVKLNRALFWDKYLKVYPEISRQALRLILPFSSTYLCEKAFTTILEIKSKDKMDTELRCVLSSVPPRIDDIITSIPDSHVQCDTPQSSLVAQ